MILQYVLLASSVFQSYYAASLTDGYKTYKDYKFYKVHGDEQKMLQFTEKIAEMIELPFANFRGSEAHFLIPPESVRIFEETARSAGLNTKVEMEDYSQIIELEKLGSIDRAKGYSWTAYYDVDIIHEFLKNVSEYNPTSTELISAGRSYEGRDILGIRINTPTETKGEKPAVFIEAGIHAREWITPTTTTYFINQLLTSSDPQIASLRDQFDWHIFPTVNPDGYHYSFNFDRMWRKTRSKSSLFCYGADANRNWDYNWLQNGATNRPCDYQTYGGSKPFSEIETKSLSEYVSGIENLLAYIAFHSDAQMLLLPYSDSTEHTDNYDDLVQIGKVSLEYGRKVNGEEYRGPATAAEILYKASGGSMDWVRHALGTPLVYTFELRGTAFHWPPQRIPEQGEEYTQMIVGMFEEAKNLGYF